MAGAPSSDAQAAATGATADNAPLTDARILAIIDAANLGEIEQARVAQTKATSNRVKQLAAHMLTEHQKAEHDQVAIAKKQNITPEESAKSRDLQSKGVQTMTTLRSSDKGSFDTAYVDAQVKEHTELLQALDNELIPNAQSSDLKAHLRELRTKVDAHLRMAKDVRASLK